MNMIQRPRRLRISSGMRDLVRETELSPRDFVYPIFVVPGEGIKEEIPSMRDCSAGDSRSRGVWAACV